MGLTLHYSARINSPDCLPEVVAEVADICRCNGWKYILLDSTPPGLPRRVGVL